MYQTERSQRHIWGDKRRKLQKERRATNLIQKVKRQGSSKGYMQILSMHRLFMLRAGLWR